MRLLRSRFVRFLAVFLLGAGFGFAAKTIAAHRERSRFAGELERRVEAERRASEELTRFIGESESILRRMEDSLTRTAEGISGAASRLRIYAKEVEEIEALVDSYRRGELRDGADSGRVD